MTWKSLQYALFAALGMAVIHALQIPKTSETEEDPKDDAKKKEWKPRPPRADHTRARLLVSTGCDASSAIIQHAHFLMKLHNVSTPWRKVPTLHDRGLSPLDLESSLGDDDGDDDESKVAASLSQFWPLSEVAWFQPPSGETAVSTEETEASASEVSAKPRVFTQEGMAAGRMVSKTQDFYTAQSKSVIFQATIGKDTTAILSSSLYNTGVLAAQVTRKNKVDQLICMNKDCVDAGKYGHPMQNGKESDICKKRRTMNSTALGDYKARVDLDTMIDTMTQLEGKALMIARDLKSIGYPMDGLLYTEDLLDFEWNGDWDAVSNARNSWMSLLKSWGIQPNRDLVTPYLLKYAGKLRDAPTRHIKSIFNFGEFKAKLDDHSRFSWMLRE